MPESPPERKTPIQQLQAETQNVANAAKRGSGTRPGDSASSIAEAARPAKRARPGNAAGFFAGLNRPQVAVTITETTGAISAAVRVPSQNLSPPPAPQALTLTPLVPDPTHLEPDPTPLALTRQEKEVVRQFTQAKASGNLPLRTQPPPGYFDNSYSSFYRIDDREFKHPVLERNVFTIGIMRGAKSYLITDGGLAISNGHLVLVRRKKNIVRSLYDRLRKERGSYPAVSAVANTRSYARTTSRTSQPYDSDESDDSRRTLSDEERLRFKPQRP